MHSKDLSYDLQKAKRAVAVNYLDDMDSNMSLATHLSMSDIIYGSWETTIEWYKDVIEVTESQIREEMNKILIRNNRTIAVIENK